MSFEVKSHTPFGGKPSLLRFWQALLVCGVSAGGCSPGENRTGEFEDIFFLEKTRGDSLLAYDWRNRRLSVIGHGHVLGRYGTNRGSKAG